MKTPSGAVAAYAPESEGPFRCDHCEYQKNLQCHRPEVVKELTGRKQSERNYSVKVEAGACCNFMEKDRRA